MSKSPIIRFNLLATVLFALTDLVTAIVFDDFTRAAIVVVALALFAVGVATFLLGYFAAVQRSRSDEIAVTQLFFLAGGVAPRDVKLPMLTALATQTVVGIACAIARHSTDGKAGSVVAFGVLVPMLGLGLNGLWASKHGRFAPRSIRPDEDSAESNNEADSGESVPE